MLTESTIGCDGAAVIAALLSTCQTLQILNLSYSNIGDQGSQVLAAAAAESKSVCSILLNGNPILLNGAAFWVPVIQSSCLQTLSFDNCQFTRKAVEVHLRAYRSPKLAE